MTAFLIPLLAGTATGVLSGFGVGGGSLLLVYLTAFAGIDQRMAQGINLIYFLPAALLSLPNHIKNRYLHTQALIPAICTGLLCAAPAAWLATGMDVAVLRKLFGSFLMVLGLREIFSRPY